MSLKAFHIFFIALSGLTVLGFGLWCIHAYVTQHSRQDLAMGILALVSVPALVLYGRRFLRKYRDLSYL